MSSTLQAADNNLEEFTVVAENNYLILYLNYETTEIAVYHKESKDTWFSSPQGFTEKTEYKSQFEISYSTPDGLTRYMNTFEDSIEYDQFGVSRINNGIRMDYTLGEEWEDDEYLPAIITENSLNELISDDDTRQELKEKYKLFALKEIADEKYEDIIEQLSITGIDDLQSVLGNYLPVSLQKELTVSEREDILRLLFSVIVNNRNDLESRKDLEKENIEVLKNQKLLLLKDDLWAWDYEEIIEIFKDFNLSPPEIKRDYQQFNLDLPSRNIRVFQIPLEYHLQGVVRILVAEVVYPRAVKDDQGEEVTYPLRTIRVLEYFGAADHTEEGYIFVPDGIGGLINLNNDKLKAPTYIRNLYGPDYSTELRNEKTGLPIVLVDLIRNTAFRGAGYGVSSAMSIFYFLSIAIILAIIIKIISPWVFYQE